MYYRGGSSMANKIISMLLVIIISFSLGWYSSTVLMKPKSNDIKITEVKEKPIYRDYDSMSQHALVDRLKCYDTSPFQFHYVNLGTSFRGVIDIENNYSLCDRSGKHQISVQVGSSGAWKVYAGVGFVAGIATIGGIAYLVKNVK